MNIWHIIYWTSYIELQAFFSQLLGCVLTARIVPFYLIFHPQFNIWCIIYSYSFIHHSRAYYELTIWPAPRWLDSSVGGALHRHRWGHGFESRSSLNFFEAFFSQLLTLRSNCENSSVLSNLSSAVQYMHVSYIHIHLFIIHGYITNSQYDQLPVGLIAQSVEHCTGIAEVMGYRSSLNFFSGFLFKPA